MVPTADETALAIARQHRLRETMRDHGVAALLTADPINIVYACGARNMTIYGLMGPVRFLLVFADGPAVLWEFAGCSHLSAGRSTLDDVRDAPGIAAVSGPGYEERAATFAAEIAAEIRRHVGADAGLAVERVELALSDALRATGLALGDATPVLLDARRLKLDLEVMAMGGAIDAVDAAVGEFAAAITDGATEIGIWAELHRGLIAREGEYVSTRLMQSGPHTFPYFQEAGPRVVRAGDLVCLDTDAIGPHGYAVDFSRTFLCGDGPATSTQRGLHALAYEQLQHNAALLAPGRSFESFARRAWTVPARHAPFGYYCIAHGIGLSGEAPNIPSAVSGRPYPLPGEFELGMTVCVESYIGDPESAQGVKLEDQYLLTPTGAERLTTYPFDPALC